MESRDDRTCATADASDASARGAGPCGRLPASTAGYCKPTGCLVVGSHEGCTLLYHGCHALYTASCLASPATSHCSRLAPYPRQECITDSHCELIV
eukprot:1758652-Prymnesium_polylepis.1